LTELQKAQELAAVSLQIVTLREQINKTNTDIYRFIEKRDKLNEQARTLRQEIVELRRERDSLNVNVRKLKQQRDEMRTTMQPFIENIKAHSEKIREIKEKRSGVPRHELQKEFDAIEWKIATTSLDLQEEKSLIEVVKQLETQLNVYKKMELHSNKISEIKAELKVFQDKANAFHEQLTADAKKSQELHAKMQAKFEELKKTSEEATNLHVMYLQAKAQILPAHEEIAKLVEQKKILQDAVRDEYELSKKSKEQGLKEKLGSQARDKLQRGEKLNWQEFQLLAGDDESEAED
jgi:uncharacterized coiled-coil DUF342 family protein